MAMSITRPGVVVGVDGSPGSKAALRWAARDAELRNAPLTVVHVVPAPARPWRESAMLPEWARGQREHGHRMLDEAYGIVDECTERGLDCVSCHMPSKHVVFALVERAHEMAGGFHRSSGCARDGDDSDTSRKL